METTYPCRCWRRSSPLAPVLTGAAHLHIVPPGEGGGAGIPPISPATPLQHCNSPHFTPTSCSWLNAVETFFAALTKRRLRRGVFRSIVDLQAAINRSNAKPKLFVWTADPDRAVMII
jgi:hypothetical protein